MDLKRVNQFLNLGFLLLFVFCAGTIIAILCILPTEVGGDYSKAVVVMMLISFFAHIFGILWEEAFSQKPYRERRK